MKGYTICDYTRLPATLKFLGQLYKDYANGNSRYMIANGNVLCIDDEKAVYWTATEHFYCLILSDNTYQRMLQIIVGSLSPSFLTAFLFSSASSYCTYSNLVSQLLEICCTTEIVCWIILSRAKTNDFRNLGSWI